MHGKECNGSDKVYGGPMCCHWAEPKDTKQSGETKGKSVDLFLDGSCGSST